MFDPIYSPKPKYVEFTIMFDTEKQQIHICYAGIS